MIAVLKENSQAFINAAVATIYMLPCLAILRALQRFISAAMTIAYWIYENNRSPLPRDTLLPFLAMAAIQVKLPEGGTAKKVKSSLSQFFVVSSSSSNFSSSRDLSTS